MMLEDGDDGSLSQPGGVALRCWEGEDGDEDEDDEDDEDEG